MGGTLRSKKTEVSDWVNLFSYIYYYMKTLNEQINRIQEMMGLHNEGLHDTSWTNEEGDKVTLIDLLDATEDIPVKNSGVDVTNLQESINNLFKTDIKKFKFTVGPNFSNYGDDITQPPIWVRPESLFMDMLDDVLYVVGHTTQKNITQIGNIILIDTLGTSQEYFIIENNKARIESIKYDEHKG